MKVRQLVILSLLILNPIYSQDLSTVFGTLSEQLPKVNQLMIGLMYMLGVLFCFIALVKLKRMAAKNAFQGGGEGNASGPIIQFFLGVFLIFSPTFIEISSQSLFSNSSSPLSYGGGSGSGLSQVYTNMYSIIQTIGLIVLIRGIIMINRVSGGQQAAQGGTYSKGIMYVIVAIFAINIGVTTDVIRASFGF